jgi:hypothetical protein
MFPLYVKRVNKPSKNAGGSGPRKEMLAKEFVLRSQDLGELAESEAAVDARHG